MSEPEKTPGGTFLIRPGDPVFVTGWTRPAWLLYVTPTFMVEQRTRPHWWWRLWQYLLLGWRWKANPR